MSESEEQTGQTGRTISLSERARNTLKVVTESEGDEMGIALFSSDTEAIRFACMLGIRVHGDNLLPLDEGKETNAETVINIGSLDPREGPSFIEAVSLLAPKSIKTEKLTRVVRRYAEWGLSQMQGWIEEADPHNDELNVATLIEKSEALIEEAAPPEEGM